MLQAPVDVTSMAQITPISINAAHGESTPFFDETSDLQEFLHRVSEEGPEQVCGTVVDVAVAPPPSPRPIHISTTATSSNKKKRTRRVEGDNPTRGKKPKSNEQINDIISNLGDSGESREERRNTTFRSVDDAKSKSGRIAICKMLTERDDQLAFLCEYTCRVCFVYFNEVDHILKAPCCHRRVCAACISAVAAMADARACSHRKNYAPAPCYACAYLYTSARVPHLTVLKRNKSSSTTVFVGAIREGETNPFASHMLGVPSVYSHANMGYVAYLFAKMSTCSQVPLHEVARWVNANNPFVGEIVVSEAKQSQPKKRATEPSQ